MIPKVIHYCWFGRKPLSELNQKCISSWNKYLPEYEIKVWNEDNFDVNIIAYTKTAYKRKQYAFVSDYARFWILYHFGGLYFDVDVEIIKPIDEIIARGSFMGAEHWIPTKGINPGLGFGMSPGNVIIKEILQNYNASTFVYSPFRFQKTIVGFTTEVLCKHGLVSSYQIQRVEGITIYPQEYFCPFHEGSQITVNTVSIHHFDGSWLNFFGRIKQIIKGYIPSIILLRYYHQKYGSPLDSLEK